METNSVQSALYSLVKKYVERQAIVFAAMRELRPDLVGGNRKISPEERAKLSLEYRKLRKAVGLWGEWGYRLHGIGCQLTHTVTQERIEWDAINLRTFDRFWFVNHLKWRLDQPVDDEAISIFKTWCDDETRSKPKIKPSFGPLHDAVFPMLEELAQSGLLTQEHQYYILLERE